MNKIEVDDIWVPLLALLLAVAGILLIRQKVKNKEPFYLFLRRVMWWSLLLHFAWEMLQMPFFAGMGLNVTDTFFCLVASIADTVMVVFLYVLFALFWTPAWPLKMNFKHVIMVMVAGGVGAVAAEWRHLDVRRYNAPVAGGRCRAGAGCTIYAAATIDFLAGGKKESCTFLTAPQQSTKKNDYFCTAP